MVGPKQIFVVDTTFILKNTAEAFHGARLLVDGDKDHTFTYGFIRDLLRTRHRLGIVNGILVVGREGYSTASDSDVEAAVTFAKDMGLLVFHCPDKSVLDICYSLAGIATHIVTMEMKIVQLSSERLMVVRPKSADEYECLTPEAVSLKFGVPPDFIPTYNALHGGIKGRQKDGLLTKRQTIRLIELYGDIDNVYANLETISSSAIRKKLSSKRDMIIGIYSESTINHKSADVKDFKVNVADSFWNFDSKRIEDLLHAHRFHSLVRLLPLPDVKVPTAVEVIEPHKYTSVRDKKDLCRLEAMLRDFDVCALDTESDDKDPRRATLLGVAFSVKKNEAIFVPLLERDLKGISSSDVIEALNRILTKRLKVVGHNIKYDALLLRRNGVHLKSIYFDTMLAAYDCFGDWDFFNLGFLAERLLGKRIKAYRDVVKKNETFLDLPLKVMRDHACQDADVAFQLHSVLDNELRKRQIREQFVDTTLKLLRWLIEREFQGIPVQMEKLENLRDGLLNDMAIKKKQIEKKFQQKIDIDSGKNLASALKEQLGNGRISTSKSLSIRRLEEMAISIPDIRTIVEYKRLRNQLKRVESVAVATRENRIFPLFNQIRAPSGRLSSRDPNLFEGVPAELKGCISSVVKDFWSNRVDAINLLQKESKDKNLQSDRRKSPYENLFMATHPLMKTLDCNELLLAIVCGVSRPAMSRKFILERIAIDTICHDLRMRYFKLFEWLSVFQNDATSCGYVTGLRGRKYLDGLKSANLAKRKKAVDEAIKWFLGQ